MQRLFSLYPSKDLSKKLFETPEKGNDSDAGRDDKRNDSDGSTVVPTKGTPKMNALFGGKSDVVIGYFGDMGFINK